MVIPLGGLAAASFLELLIWVPGFWQARKLLAPLVGLVLVVFGAWLFAVRPTVWTALIELVSFYRLFNNLRIIKGRMHQQYLHKTTGRTALAFMGLQLGIVLVWGFSTWLSISLRSWLFITTGLAVAATVILGASTLRHLRTTRLKSYPMTLTSKELPTLTVAIPARNETDDLEACLKSLVANDYPKLEILVLDDCSQNARTPEIIRSFAHDGVRFVEGAEPSDTWLAKNQAYQRLYEEASGELILFCGVDTQFEPNSLRALVTVLLKKQKTMLSVMPENRLPAGSHRLAVLLVQPMRYAWELALPRRMFNRPPVLSTCWLTYRQEIAKAGTFAAVSRQIVPESYFVRRAILADGYSFVQSNAEVPLISNKSAAEQRDTAIRTRYPQLHRKPELVCLLSMVEVGLFAIPLTNLVVALLQHYAWWVAITNAVVCALLLYFYNRIAAVTYRRPVTGGLVALPAALLYDVGLLHLSMWRYEFSEVLWKGRNVCVPVMHVYPHLPPAELRDRTAA